MTRRFLMLPFVLALLLLAGCGGRQEIVGELGEKEANEIVVLLASNGIDAQKMATKATGAGAQTAAVFSISVPAGKVTDSLAILNQHGLPRRPGPSLLSLFPKSGLVSSAQEEQIRYQEGLAEQIAGTIRKIDGVVDAVVQISFPAAEQGALMPSEMEKQEVRAAVYVKHTGVLDDPNSQLVVKIKRLVAASAVGLTYDNVTVISDRARFSDLSLEEQMAILPEDQREYTSVWGIVIWKRSVGTFQTIFIVLSIIVLILAGFVAWILWKLFPALQQAGGLAALFTSTKPLYPEGVEPKKKKKEEEEEEYPEEGEE